VVGGNRLRFQAGRMGLAQTLEKTVWLTEEQSFGRRTFKKTSNGNGEVRRKLLANHTQAGRGGGGSDRGALGSTTEV